MTTKEQKKFFGILMNRQNINSEIYLYNPKYIIEGTLITDDDEKIFKDKMGNEYFLSDNVATISFNMENTVSSIISKEDLLKRYPSLSVKDAMSEYFNEICMKIFLGYYILVEDKIVIRSYDIQNVMTKLQFGEEDENILEDVGKRKKRNYQLIDDDKEALSHSLEKYSGDQIIPITALELKKIIDLKSYDAIKNKLLDIYQKYNDLNKYFLPEENIPEFPNLDLEITGEKVTQFFQNIIYRFEHLNNLEESEQIVWVLEDSLIKILTFLENFDNSKNIEIVHDFIYQLIDEIKIITSLDDLNIMKNKVLEILQRESINFKQLATTIDEYRLKKFKPDISLQQSSTPKIKIENKSFKLVNVKEMKAFFDRRIIGQEQAKKLVISAIAMNNLSETSDDRVSCLLVGPTGSGKTLIAKTVSDFLDIPMEVFDTTQLTVPGYVGGNLEDLLIRLLSKADGNLKKAEQGIVVFDELDKKGSDKNDDISGKGVLNTLLSFIEGTSYNVKYNGKNMIFNTSKLTIFATGAFTDVVKGKIQNSDSDSYKATKIGFNSDFELTEEIQDIEYPNLERQDFVKYGKMTDEIMGRITTIAQLSGHTKESLKSILTNSELSFLVNTKRKLEKIGICLAWTEEYLDAVAEKALKLKMGARSLKSIVEETILEARWEVLQHPDLYSKVILTEKTVLDPCDYNLVDNNGIIHNFKENSSNSEKQYMITRKNLYN